MEDLTRAYSIRCCRDRTLTYVPKGKPSFNGVALPVYSVDTEDEAKELIIATCRVQYNEHPDIPGMPWRKITLDGSLDFKPYLDPDDLEAVTAKLKRVHNLLKEPARG